MFTTRNLWWGAVAAALLAALVATPAQAQTVLPRFFSPTSFWNTPLPANAPLDPNSATLVAEMRRLVARDQAARVGPWIATRQYSSPVYTVPLAQPKVTVKLDGTAPPPAMQAAFNAVPLPPDAKPAAGLDQQLTVFQPSTNKLWEFWKLARKEDGWHALWGGAMQNVSTSPGYFSPSSWPGAEYRWGATASSLPLAGGLLMIDELQRKRADHAVAVGIPFIRRRVWSWPAQRTDGADSRPEAIPMGARFRIDPNLDLSKLTMPDFTRTVAQAVQRYGMVVRDTGGIQFYGEDPSRLATNPYPQIFGPLYPNQFWKILASFPWDRLQLLRMDLRTIY